MLNQYLIHSKYSNTGFSKQRGTGAVVWSEPALIAIFIQQTVDMSTFSAMGLFEF